MNIFHQRTFPKYFCRQCEVNGHTDTGTSYKLHTTIVSLHFCALLVRVFRSSAAIPRDTKKKAIIAIEKQKKMLAKSNRTLET